MVYIAPIPKIRLMATAYQIEILERKLKEFKPNEQGQYDSKYYALFNKIKKLRQELDKQKWREFLAK